MMSKYEDTKMYRANEVDCRSTSEATYNPEFTGRNQIIQTERQHSGSPKFYKVLIALLALLIGALLAVLIVLTVKNRKHTLQLKTDYEQCTEDQDRLNQQYNSLTLERDQLQAREKDQIKKVKTLEKLLPVGCMTGWSNFSSHLYCVSTTMLSWNESRHSCAEIDAYLVIINSPEEQDFVSSNVKVHAWIGLAENLTEGEWKWVDNTELIQQYWMTGEPNDVNANEDCVEIIPDWPRLQNWNDYVCEEKKYYICEYEF